MSGKPRRTKPNRRGRPTNQHLIDKLTTDNQRLRDLLIRRRLKDETWKHIANLLDLIAWLEDQQTPLTGRNYQTTGHPADTPILPATHLSDHPGDRNLYHPGRYAQDLLRWLHRELEYAHQTVESELRGKEPPPKPDAPKIPRTQHPPKTPVTVTESEGP